MTDLIGRTFTGLDADIGDQFIADRVSFYQENDAEKRMYSLNGQAFLVHVNGELENLVDSPITHASIESNIFTGEKKIVLSTVIGSVEFVWVDGDVGEVGIY